MLRTASSMAPSPPHCVGMSGRKYVFKQLIQERPHAGRVWPASSDILLPHTPSAMQLRTYGPGEDDFVLKDIPEKIHAAFESETRAKIKESLHLRLPIDTIKDQRVFVYQFLNEDFLALVKTQISLKAKKEILKASLQGLADLHACDVVHLDVKPDNVMVDGQGSGSDFTVQKVQLTDLENAAYLPKGRCIKGMLPGNDNWRSPEGHLRSELNKSTDMFSFGAMCIYAVLGRVIFRPDEDMKKYTDQGAIAWIVRLQRQISYFGNKEDINGLMAHVGDDETSLVLLSNAYDGKDDDDHGYKHFSTWTEVNDNTFKDLVLSLMKLDPKKRISAKQALEHPWFKDAVLK